MGFGRDEILRPLPLAHRESRHTGPGGGNGIELCAVAEGVTKVQRVRTGELLIQPKPELIRALRYDLRRRVDVGAVVRYGEETQKAQRKRARIGLRERHLVKRIRLVEENVEQLVHLMAIRVGIFAEAAIVKSFESYCGEVSRSLRHRGHRRRIRLALMVSKA